MAVAVAALFYLKSLAGFVLPPRELWVPPSGTAWLDFLPVSQGLFFGGLFLAALAAVAAGLGLYSRPALWLLAIGIFYVGWVTTLTGKVDHIHHLMWTAAILAVSPSANVWAVRPDSRQGSYKWPALAVMFLIGVIYFGAGLQKLASAGFGWGWSENLVNTMLVMGWEKNQPVQQWLVDWPVGGRLLGTFALVFELTFLPLILIPPTRKWVWPAGLLFHWGTWLILGIPFLSLQLFYVVFLSWDRTPTAGKITKTQTATIAALCAGVLVAAVTGKAAAWPVAAYPGFKGIADLTIQDVEVVQGEQRQFVTDLEQARQVSPQRILPLVRASLSRQPERLAAWLQADELYYVTIEVTTGAVLDREPIYP